MKMNDPLTYAFFREEDRFCEEPEYYENGEPRNICDFEGEVEVLYALTSKTWHCPTCGKEHVEE